MLRDTASRTRSVRDEARLDQDLAAMTEPRPSPLPFGHLSSYRVETLADGVFAIAMTLLVLDLEVPSPDLVAEQGGLVPALFLLWPRLLAYGISFVILGIYWTAHHTQYHSIKQVDFRAIWINLAFLLLVTALPFSTSLMAAHLVPAAIVVYSLNAASIGLVLLCHWTHGTSRPELLRGTLDPNFVRLVRLHILFAPGLYLMAVPLAFLHVGASLVLLVVAPLLNLTGLSFALPAWILRQRRG